LCRPSTSCCTKDVDAWHKAGHDEVLCYAVIFCSNVINASGAVTFGE
jgi:hypothetical protein